MSDAVAPRDITLEMLKDEKAVEVSETWLAVAHAAQKQQERLGKGGVRPRPTMTHTPTDVLSD